MSVLELSNIQRCPLFGRDEVNSGRGAGRPKLTRTTHSALVRHAKVATGADCFPTLVSNCVKASNAWLAYITDGPAPI
jgi:hypothetical protein